MREDSNRVHNKDGGIHRVSLEVQERHDCCCSRRTAGRGRSSYSPGAGAEPAAVYINMNTGASAHQPATTLRVAWSLFRIA
jgi:hypothetical protein